MAAPPEDAKKKGCTSKLLQAAIENEVINYIQSKRIGVMENGLLLVVRNGHLPEWEIISGIGPIKVRQPRLRHRVTEAVLQCVSARLCAEQAASNWPHLQATNRFESTLSARPASKPSN
jgi:hypothetical protein